MRAASNAIGLLVLAVALAACGGTSDTEEPAATAEARDESASAPAETPAHECPPDSEIAGIVGAPVARGPGGSMCFYQTADFAVSVTIMRITAGQADQLEREMRDSASPYAAEVGPIDVGDRGSAWGSPGYGQGYAIEGDRGWLVDVTDSSSGSTDKKAEVIRFLEWLMG